MPEDTEWSSQLVFRLRELHDQGLSFTRIAKQLNTEFNLALTPNACIGKARRLNFPMRYRPPPPRKRKPRAPPAPKMVTIKPAVPPRPPLEPAPLPDLPTVGAIELMQLTGKTCHWPQGFAPPYTYCGEPTHLESPFCRHHYDRAYVGPSKRWR
jgi:hypothetical protein